MKPWGHIDWLLSFYPSAAWTLISGIGFERRSATLIEHLSSNGTKLSDIHCIHVDDPENEHTARIDQLTNEHLNIINASIGGISVTRSRLLGPHQQWYDLVEFLAEEGNTSVILDITSLPKRISLFILKQLLSQPKIENLVVCYTKAQGYREGYLAQDVQPPSALPGFGLDSTRKDESVVVMSVGYSAFDLREVLQEASSPDIHFLMPFPPASPSFRRSWKFLKILNEKLELVEPTVERISAYDTFAVYDWIMGLMNKDKNLIMLPLGPKPHSLAMALAQIDSKDNAEIIYPQPRLYHPDYATGVHRERNGRPSILAYAMRRNAITV